LVAYFYHKSHNILRTLFQHFSLQIVGHYHTGRLEFVSIAVISPQVSSRALRCELWWI
jgi:hypothetical protein